MVKARVKNTAAKRVNILFPSMVPPRPVVNLIQHPARKNIIMPTRPDIPKLHTYTTTANGLATTPAAETPTTTSITLGSTGALQAELAEATFGGWAAEGATVSGSAVFIFPLPPMTTDSATTGRGTVTKS